MAHSGQFVTADSFAEEADGPVAETSNVVSSLAPLVHEAIRLAQARPDSSQDDVSGARTVKSPGVEPSTLSFPYQYGAGFPVVPVPPRTAPRPSFHALQEWEGYVLKIRDGEFVARLIDLTSGSSHEDEEATIPLAEISDEDAATLREGGIFRWVIGYQRDPSGAKKHVSQIVFRDLPRLTERDFQQGEEWARKTIQALKVQDFDR